MKAYYNENDPKAAAWLRELIKGGHIAPGEVDERSIEDIRPNELVGYTQCHFFAGIGGWSYALRLAGVADSERVWTGSCPCQPFSAAGKGAGFADERHLWPAWFHLIRELRPDRVFGEQVANALSWFDLVSGDLENEAYAVGGAIIGAHSVGAPHIRQRLYWVAHNNNLGREVVGSGGLLDRESAQRNDLDGRGTDGDLAITKGQQLDRVGDPRRGRGEPADDSELGHTESNGRLERRTEPDGRSAIGAWDNADWVACRDGKQRPVEPGSFPLAHGVPGRVGLLRGYGNAIVPQDAAVFIEATRRLA